MKVSFQPDLLLTDMGTRESLDPAAVKIVILRGGNKIDTYLISLNMKTSSHI